MYSDGVWLILGGFLAVWLGVLSFLVWRQRNFFSSLFPKSGERDIRIKFEEVLKAVEDFKGELKRVEIDLGQLEEEGLLHISRLWLMRYNPYEDTGGDQSFTIALLNKKGSGIVVTSLHARSATRVFAKPIVEGKSIKYRLSKEEEQVIEKAMK